MKPLSLKTLLLACTLLSAAVQAEDIDIYSAPPTSPPNVLIIIDNTANWNTAFENEMAALLNTVSALPDKKFRIGFLFANETGSPNNNVTGGYVRAAIRTMDAVNKLRYQNLIKSFDKIADKGNGGVSSLVMAEAYFYLSGGAPYAGNYKVKTDYTGNDYASLTAANKAVIDSGSNALSTFSATKYNSPILDGCQKNVIIYISNGASNDNSTVVGQSESMLTAAGGDKTTIALLPNGSQGNPMDEWARFMKAKLGVTTFTIDVDKVTTGQGPGWSALLQSMASQSLGTYFDVSSADPDALTKAMAQIFSDIQEVDSTFAEVSLPESSKGEGDYLNQVFISMFRTDSTGAPRWAGNLKQYSIGYDPQGAFGLLDADGKRAISADGTGFIDQCARSYWTPSAVDTYWTFSPMGGCPDVANSDKSNSPDGQIVEKGGQAYRLRTKSTRVVKTCSPVFTACTEFTEFSTANTAITQAMLDPTPGATNRNAIINWARGLNVDAESNTSYTMRPSIHGDVVHSAPLALNYGSDSAPQVVVFYGGNDGILRAVNGHRSDPIAISATATAAAGDELWAFMAPEFYGNINRLRTNTPPVAFFGATFMDDPAPKAYGFDGPIVARRGDNIVQLYAAMRRGGRALYSFDVTNPASPVLKWKKGCSDTGCTQGFDGIGQTWSRPKTIFAAGYEGGAEPLLIMGGGYDSCEDSDPHSCTSATKGNKVYVMDAESGDLLKTFSTDRAVIADIFIVKNSMGQAQFGYVADLGGNVYRIDMAGNAPANWTMTKIAALGCAAPGTCSPNRKFMFSPDVVEQDGKYLVLLGSGDREKPLLGYTSAASVSNYFFMFKDDPYDSTWLEAEAENCGGSSLICLNSLYRIERTAESPTVATVDEKKGWYLTLRPTEQVVTSALTIFGTVRFGTHIPAVPTGNSCDASLGEAWLYEIYYGNAASTTGTESRSKEVAGGGLLANPKGGTITLDDGTSVPFCTTCSDESGIQPQEPPAPDLVYQPKSRVYWHIQP